MEHSISILLGIIITISLAGIAIVYMTNYTIHITEEYTVTSHVRVYESSEISIITITYTNTSDTPIISFEGVIPSCNCRHTSAISTEEYTGVISWNEFGKDVSGIIEMSYTFEDGVVTSDIEKLR